MPPNPHIRAGPADDVLARALAPPSETAETDSELSPEVPALKELQQKFLVCDQRSFLTGSASADLQAAHIINAARKPNHQVRKMEVPTASTSGGFLLDGPSNAILCLHLQWNTYGTFCFVPAEPDAKAILDALRQSDRDWKKHYEATHDFPVRPLDITAPPFDNPHWDVIILHPHALLPDGQPILISQTRTFYLPGQPVPEPGLSWKGWIPSVDRLCSMSEPHEPFPPFTAQDVRKHFGHPSVSSLAMIINAHWKLDHFMGEHAGSATPRVKNRRSRGQPATASLGAGHVDPSGETSALSSGSRPSGAPEFETPEAPEDEDEDGLTNTEFRLLSAQARDLALDSRQRANAAMIMLFGTHQPTNPYVERTQAIDAFNNMSGESGSGGYHPDQS
ncbi:hypothetical protein NLJ89_g9180 [Agrocybe chaxingu]|uniref:Uncharacterized protein n=1 Tax=Agrocybe chaxingu TaxID=84603 RepID=A0A9W8JU10_9AGAR|nr:hypothetical protein NLJ89_g9180 [Agrocybe chaxingu]